MWLCLLVLSEGNKCSKESVALHHGLGQHREISESRGLSAETQERWSQAVGSSAADLDKERSTEESHQNTSAAVILRTKIQGVTSHVAVSITEELYF